MSTLAAVDDVAPVTSNFDDFVNNVEKTKIPVQTAHV